MPTYREKSPMLTGASFSLEFNFALPVLEIANDLTMAGMVFNIPGLNDMLEPCETFGRRL